MKEISSKIITYSLLAHINDHNQGIKDLNDLFVPLVKRILSQMVSEGITKGEHINEIKCRVDKTYYLDIPFPLLNKIISKIAKEIESTEGQSFIIYNDQAFSINNYTFNDFEEEISEEESNIERIEELYDSYLELKGIKKLINNNLFEFIDKNRAQLIPFFSKNKIEENANKDFSIQANFINSLKMDPRLYKIICKIYLGSIIVSYLEFEPEKTEVKGEKEFLIDTNFIIGLFDLNSIESVHTCRKIVEICKRLNYKISVLDLTIQETRNLIQRAANSLDSTFLQKKIDPESIYNACDRRNLSKTDLEKMSSNLESILRENYSINIIYDSVKYQNEARYSREYEIYKGVRSTSWSALHDATAIKYIQKKRNSRYIDYFSANCFFVTNTSRDFKPLLDTNSVSEIIRAEDLVNILWLTNPNVKLNIENSVVAKIGLSRLISSTLNSKLPSHRIIKELDDNIQKYAKDRITDKDIIRVSNRIANKTLDNLESLNKLAQESPDRFVERLNLEARREEEIERESFKKLKSLLKQIQSSSEEKIKEKEKFFKQEFEIAKKQFEDEVDDKFDLLLKDNERKLFELKLENYQKLELIKISYDKVASRNSKLLSVGIFIIPLIVLLCLFWFFSWSELEPIITKGTLAYYILIYLYFAFTEKHWSIKQLYLSLKEHKLKKYYSKYNFDLEYFIKLQSEIVENKNEFLQTI